MIANDYGELPRDKKGFRSNTVDIRDLSTILYSSRIPSCATSLFGTNLDDIKNLCGYDIIFSELPTSVVRISETKILLNNVDKLVVNRPKRQNVLPINDSVIIPNDPQIIYEIPCESTITVLDQIFHSSKSCNDFHDYPRNMSYIMNLPILTHYLVDDLLVGSNADIWLNETIHAKLPPLAIEKAEYKHLIAKEAQYKFNFQHVVNESRQEEGLYSSLSHLIWSKMLQNEASSNDFNIFNTFHWSTCRRSYHLDLKHSLSGTFVCSDEKH